MNSNFGSSDSNFSFFCKLIKNLNLSDAWTSSDLCELHIQVLSTHRHIHADCFLSTSKALIFKKFDEAAYSAVHLWMMYIWRKILTEIIQGKHID